ncbi:MAG: hypothetical protein IAF38_03955 [Bacteroidia bacterium]|nr:hypothetical protein [Bacteroidia bacterium]
MKQFIFILFSTFLFGFYKSKIENSDLIGTWKLSSHTYLNNGKKESCDCKAYFQEISLKKDGTYKIFIKAKAIEKGNWKLKTKDSIFFYNCQFIPKDTMNIKSDDLHKVISFSKTQFILKEVVCSEVNDGESIYIRVK